MRFDGSQNPERFQNLLDTRYADGIEASPNLVCLRLSCRRRRRRLCFWSSPGSTVQMLTCSSEFLFTKTWTLWKSIYKQP
jgi:hypothetical protein